jgi:dipeptidyl aminopeptidase/acylaminoacyl peptidase
MLNSILAIGAITFATLATSVLASEKSNLALYGALPTVEAVEISPDGSKLATVTTNGEQRFLTVRWTEGGGIAGIALGATKLRSVNWAGEDHLVLVASRTATGLSLTGPAREYFMASDFNIATNKQKPLLEGLTGAKDTVGPMNIIVGPPQVRTINGDPVVFLEGVHFMRGLGTDTLFRVNLRTGVTKMLDQGARFDTDSWLVDAAGDPVAQSLYDGKKGRGSLLLKVGSGWKTVDVADSPTGSYGLSGFGRDGKSVLVRRGADNEMLREYRANGAQEALPDDLKFSGLLHDPDKLNLLGGYRLKDDDLSYTFFDPATQSAWRAAIKPFKGSRVTMRSWSRNMRRIVVRVDSPTDGPAYALIDLGLRRGWYLSPVYRGLDALAISPVRPISYRAADGLRISGYLTLPRDRDPTNLPLIVLPHGGPEGRDTLDFDWWSQALASRGYAVLRSNFRGSEGFGADFVRAGFGEWGGKMQTDLSDGVRDLAKQGLIDPKRVCIMGASYGGYAALAGATMDQGVYRCAVSVAGPSDLGLVRQEVIDPQAVCMEDFTILGQGSSRGPHSCSVSGAGPKNPGRMLVTDRAEHSVRTSTSQRYWLSFMDADVSKTPDLRARSPARLAEKADIPILLIHGQDDTVVPYEQSRIMADALKRAGKPVNLVTLEGEDHWLSHGATRLKMLTEAVAFVEKHNPPN